MRIGATKVTLKRSVSYEIVVNLFLDRELTLYRYLSLCSSCFFCWGDALHKSLKLRRFKSDRDVI